MDGTPEERHAEDRPISIYRKGERIFAVADDLLLIEEGATADEAIQKLRTEIRNRYALLAVAGAVAPPTLAKRLTPFFLKTAAVTLACVAVVLTLELAISRTFDNFPRHAASMALSTVSELGQMSQWVSEERKREIGRSIRLLLENLQPVIEEVRPGLLGGQTPSPDLKSGGASGPQ